MPDENAYGLSKRWEAAAGCGYGAALAATKLEVEKNFRPDIIIGHIAWGELTYMKQVWPKVPIISYCEYYYNMTGGLTNFDPEVPISTNRKYFEQSLNVQLLANLAVMDQGVSPTRWQRDRYPKCFHTQMYVCHDGIRTDLLKPNQGVRLSPQRLQADVTRDDEIFTYLARNLEHARGFHVFMRALPKILRERPKARVLIVGGNAVSYESPKRVPGGLRKKMLAEVGGALDLERVHFLGRVPYADFQKFVQISRCHIYLSTPFVLSWSLLEAMSMGATVVASNVAPVREVMKHGENGLLVDFFDPDGLADQVIRVLQAPADYAHLGLAARQHIISKYDFLTKCLPKHLREINKLVSKEKRIQLP